MNVLLLLLLVSILHQLALVVVLLHRHQPRRIWATGKERNPGAMMMLVSDGSCSLISKDER